MVTKKYITTFAPLASKKETGSPTKLAMRFEPPEVKTMFNHCRAKITNKAQQ